VAGVTGPSVVHVLPDKMGGAVNLTRQTSPVRRRDAFRHIALLTHNSLSTTSVSAARSTRMLRRSSIRAALENIHRRAASSATRRCPTERACWSPTILLDLALASAFDCGRT